MTRWKAQGIATVAWFAGAFGLTFAMPESHGGWITLPNFPILFLFLFGPIAVVVTLATTVLVAVWRTIPLRTLVGVHVAIAAVFLIWLAAKANGH
jgi:hypothetical protein